MSYLYVRYPLMFRKKAFQRSTVIGCSPHEYCLLLLEAANEGKDYVCDIVVASSRLPRGGLCERRLS